MRDDSYMPLTYQLLEKSCNNNIFFEKSFTELFSNFVLHGADYIYSVAQSFYSFDYTIFYFQLFNLLFDESCEIFFYVCWKTMIVLGPWELIKSLVFDSYITQYFLNEYFTETWYRTVLASRDISLISIYHPEFYLLCEQYNNSIICKVYSEIRNFIPEVFKTERFFTAVSTFMDFLFFLTLVLFITLIYFSYFTTSTKEDLTIDYDYLISSSTVEGEKEITGIDDMISGLILIVFLIFWYFYAYCWVAISENPELIILLYLIPFLMIFIIFIPVNLIYDFGSLFLAYLRGVGATSIILYELMFDYIALLIFFVRIMVQGVRILLIVFAYSSMQELILTQYYSNYTFYNYEGFWDELSKVSLNLKSMSWYLTSTLPNRLIYWIYEVLHVFFVLTAQCGAFLAIIFWLYLFLYTFFVLEKQEDYFYYKRIEKRIYFNKIKIIYVIKSSSFYKSLFPVL